MQYAGAAIAVRVEHLAVVPDNVARVFGRKLTLALEALHGTLEAAAKVDGALDRHRRCDDEK